jgi:hypothetical protein
MEPGCGVASSLLAIEVSVANFRQSAMAPNYLGRREQRRLLVMFGLLGLVFYAMYIAQKPETWYWMWGGPEAARNWNNLSPEAEQVAAIDTRLKLEESEGVAGGFMAPAPKALPPGEYFPGVDPDLLAEIRDDTVFRGAEHEAFFHLMNVLHETEARQLAAASRGPTAFVQLYEQPDHYRGKLVTVRGTLLRAFLLPAPKNDYGIEEYYQTWIRPHDNRANPMVIYVLKIPAGFPTGMNLSEEIECTGFFYKRWAYKAADSIRTAPLLLASTVEWNRPVVKPDEPVSPGSVMTIVLAGLGLGGLILFTALSRRRAPEVAWYQSRKANPDTTRRRLHALEQVETGPPVEEALRQLAEESDDHDAPPIRG